MFIKSTHKKKEERRTECGDKSIKTNVNYSIIFNTTYDKLNLKPIQ